MKLIEGMALTELEALYVPALLERTRPNTCPRNKGEVRKSLTTCTKIILFGNEKVYALALRGEREEDLPEPARCSELFLELMVTLMMAENSSLTWGEAERAAPKSEHTATAAKRVANQRCSFLIAGSKWRGKRENEEVFISVRNFLVVVASTNRT